MGKKRNIIMQGEIIEEAPKQESSSTVPSVNAPKTTKTPKTPKKSPTPTRGKHYKQALLKIDKAKTYAIEEAIKLVREVTYSKKNETIEAHINLGLDMTKAEHKVRVMVSYPHGTGKEIKILTIEQDENEKIEKITSGKLIPGKDFDLVVAHPATMKELAKVAKILGPKGMMPNPKSGTVSDNPKKTAEELQKGATEIKTEKGAPIIHTIIGKLSFEDKKLLENFETLINKIKEVRPPKVKGIYIKSVFLKSSMSPSIKIAL